MPWCGKGSRYLWTEGRDMRITRALNLQGEAQARLRYLASRAVHHFMTYSDLCAEKSEIMKSVAKCPQWVSARLYGYWDAQIERVYSEHLEYCSRQADGKIYSHHSDSHRYYGKHGISPSQCHEEGREHGHYWINTDNPFYAS